MTNTDLSDLMLEIADIKITLSCYVEDVANVPARSLIEQAMYDLENAKSCILSANGIIKNEFPSDNL